MDLIVKAIRIIDYENDKIIKRDIPQDFSNYINELLEYIINNRSIREYQTRSRNTEVIHCVLQIIKHSEDSEFIEKMIEVISRRLLLKESKAQMRIAHLGQNVQKGSLIQALYYEPEENKYIYLLTTTDHSDFYDDFDFSVKSGFSKDKKKIWKSCVFEIIDVNADIISAKIYSDTSAHYWDDGFLELDAIRTDETNTDASFQAIEKVLNRYLKNEHKDKALIKNSIIGYIKSNDYIDYDVMIEQVMDNYHPSEVKKDKLNKVTEIIKKLPDEKNFDRQFNSKPTILDKKIKTTYEIRQGIQLKVMGGIENLFDLITTYRDDDGNRYLKIKIDNEITYNTFFKDKS